MKKADLGDLFRSQEMGEEAFTTAFQKAGEPPAVWSDRDKGIPSWFDVFSSAFSLHCSWHLCSNLFKNAGGKCKTLERMFWGLQASESKKEFEEKLRLMANFNHRAAAYLTSAKLERNRWVAYAIAEDHGVYTHGGSTSQGVESANGVIKVFRRFDPLHCIDMIVKHQSRTLVRRRDEASKMTTTEVRRERSERQRSERKERRSWSALPLFDPPTPSLFARAGGQQRCTRTRREPSRRPSSKPLD